MSNTIASLLADPRLSLLLGVAVRSLIVPVLGALVLVWMGRKASAAARYLVMLVCMLGLLALPLLSWLAPAWRVPVLPASVTLVGTAASTSPAPASAPVSPTAANAIYAAAKQSGGIFRTFLAPRQEMLTAVPVARHSGVALRLAVISPAGVVTLLWLGGAALYGGWLLVGRLRLWRLAQRCPVVAAGPLRTQIQELAVRCEVRLPILVRQAAREDNAFVTPMTWGWRRPVLLLPGGVLEEWPAERLQAVLLHELAHIARLDWLTQGAAQLTCALYWFNPLVWRMAAAMEREAEQACDDRVLLAGVQASDYASHLLEVVKSLRSLHGAVLHGGAQTMAAPRSNVQARLMAILAADRNRAQATRRAALLALAVSVLVLAPLAALHPARAAAPARRKAAPFPTDSNANEQAINRAIRWSIRGDWAKEAQEIAVVLNDPNASDSALAEAYWCKFDSAWFMDDPKGADRYYRLLAAIAKKHPEDRRIQGDLQLADRYRSLPTLKTLSNQQLLDSCGALMVSQAYADSLHTARYLLNRAGVPARMRAGALICAYAGAYYWNYKDTQELLKQQFQAELQRLPKADRQQLEGGWDEVIRTIQPRGADNEFNPVSGVAWKRVTLQAPTNLDFRNGLTDWTLSAQDGKGKDYRIGIDPNVAPDGPAAYLTAANRHPEDDAGLTQTCRADAFRGKRIRYSALVRTESVQKWADFYLDLDAPDRVRTWNRIETPIVGTTDWRRYEYVADVPENGQGVIFGIALEGAGKVWVRDVRFEVVDQSVPLSPASNDFPVKGGQVLRANFATQHDLPAQPVNFQFANGLTGWGNDNPEGTATQDYQIGIDDRATYNGHVAAFLTSKVNNPRSYGTLMQNIRADAYRGKRIRYSAYLKTQGAAAQKPNEGAGLWIVLESVNQQDNRAWNMTNSPIRGTTDWKQYRWVLDVPTDAQELSLGIDQTGKGKVWVSDFQIEVVGNDVPLTPPQ